MATPVQFVCPSGLTLSVELYPYASDTIANGAGGDAATEKTNCKSLYEASIAESLTGWHNARIKDGSGATVAQYHVYMRAAAAIHRCEEAPAKMYDGAAEPQVDPIKWLGTALATPTVAGVPEVDVTHFGGIAGTFNLGWPSVSVVAANILVIADAIWDEARAGHTTGGTFGEGVVVAAGGIVEATFAADTSKYQSKVTLLDDNGGTTDRYVVVWFKNGQPVTSGITSPTIQVVKVADGADLIASAAMTQIASLGMYRYDATAAERIVSGVAYIAKVTATIDSATRTWFQPVGRDST